MEETKILDSTQSKCKVLKYLLIIATALLVLGLIISVITYFTGSEFIKGHWFFNPFTGKDQYYEDHYVPYTERYDSFTKFFVRQFWSKLYGYLLIISILSYLSFIFIYYLTNTSSLTLTNKRILGYSSFGKQVDMPLGQLTSITSCAFNGLMLTTSSGKTRFWRIEDRDKVREAISTAMINQ